MNSFIKTTAIFSLPLIFALFAVGCQPAAKQQALKARQMQEQKIAANQNRVDSVLQTAFSQVGRLYRYGGNTPETGFDCSGFVRWVYDQYDVDLPRTSRTMLGVGTPVARDELRPGDLVFFGRKRVSHVGIYTGDDKFIHSPSRGRRIQESEMNYGGRGERFMGARRIIDNEGAEVVGEHLKQAWVELSRQQTAAQNPPSSAKNSQARVNKESAAKQAKKHKVRSGDTIYEISKKYGVSAAALVKANNLNGRRKSQLRLGQTILVPAAN